MRTNDSHTIAEAVADFAVHMTHKLLLNRHKPHWSNYTNDQLFERVKQETRELLLAIEDDDRKAIVEECADVANFLMMIADNAAKAGVPCEQTENGGSQDAELESEWHPGDVMCAVHVGGDMGFTQKLIKGDPGADNFWVCSCAIFRCSHEKDAAREYGIDTLPRRRSPT